MLIIPPPKFRKSRRIEDDATAAPTPPPPTNPLVLQSVAYVPNLETATLTFDRDIDVSGFDGTQVTVIDGLVNLRQYQADNSTTQPSATQVTLTLLDLGGTPPAVQNLSATALTGIVAVDDGGTWPGVTDEAFSSVDLNLISAVYDYVALTLTLEFDRAVNCNDFDGTQLTVNDGQYNATQYNGTHATLTSPTQVLVGLQEVGPCTDKSATLSATNLTRLFADDDGGTWPGVTDYPLDTPAQPLALQSVEYFAGESITLLFDRAVDVSHFDGSQVTIMDAGATQTTYLASNSTTQPDPTQVTLTLVAQGPYTGDTNLMDATALTGIVAVDDGGTWPGVTDFPIGH